LDEGRVVGRLLLPAEQQAAEAVAPAVRGLDHPAARRVPVGVAGRGQRVRGAPPGREMRAGAVGGARLPTGGVSVAALPAQLRRGGGAGLDARVEPVRRLLHGGAVGPADGARQRDAPARGQRVPPGPARAPVGGGGPGRLRRTGPPFLPRGALTRPPSAACHAQPSATSSSYTASRRAHARARQPCPTHAWKRAWPVDLAPHRRGSVAHCPPLRASPIRPSQGGRPSSRGATRLLARLRDRQERPQFGPQRVVHAPDRRVIACHGTGRRVGSMRIHPRRIAHPATFRIGC
jgi:hypothetical protein